MNIPFSVSNLVRFLWKLLKAWGVLKKTTYWWGSRGIAIKPPKVMIIFIVPDIDYTIKEVLPGVDDSRLRKGITTRLSLVLSSTGRRY